MNVLLNKKAFQVEHLPEHGGNKEHYLNAHIEDET